MEQRDFVWWRHRKLGAFLRAVLFAGCLLAFASAKLWQTALPLYALVPLCCALLFALDRFAAFVCAALASGLIILSADIDSGVQILLALSPWTAAIVRFTLTSEEGDSTGSTGLSIASARLKQDLDQARRDLRDAQEFRTHFAQYVSHELRTPINLLVGFSEALVGPNPRREALPDAYMEDMQAIHRNATRLQSLIDDLLSDAKIETAVTAWATRTVDPADIIRTAAVFAQPLMQRRNLELTLNLREPIPPMALNRTLLRQAVLSLLKSAAHFTRQARLSLNVQVQDAALSIRLDGSGIPASVLEASEPESEGKTDMASCQRIVRMNRGQVWLQKAGPGQAGQADQTTVFLTIPMNASESVNEALTRRDVILLEDNPDVIDTFRRHITHYNVISVPDPRDLNRLMQRAPVSALILSNERLHSQLGARQVLALRGVPIIVCSLPTIGSLMQAHHTDYLMKPVTYSSLSAALTKVPTPVRDILVIDDNHDMVRMLAQMLGSILPDAQIWRAYCGQEGMAVLRERQPDAVILDVNLPDIDGWTIIQYVRRDSRYENTPILLISGTSLAETIQADGHITVFDPTVSRPGELIRRIESLVNSFETTRLPQF